MLKMKQMFSVIYSFKTKPGQSQNFEKAWEELTRLIYVYEGSLGSRLHKKGENHYIAYAQWPDREKWSSSGMKLPDSAAEVRKRMKDCCSSIETLHELEVINDLLQDKTRS